MANREIEARLKISAIDRTGQVLASLGKRLEGVSKNVDGLNRHMNTLSSFAGNALGFLTVDRLAQGVKGAVVDYAALERQFKRMGVTAGASDQEITDALAEVQKRTKDLGLPLQDGIDSMQVMTASGKSLKEALQFLPSMLATLQATGASAEDVTNTGLKATDALKINADRMLAAFDLMVKGSKEGQFEFKDMAAYVPNLANSFAALGYKGEDGLKRLVAMLQTVREDTGSAEEAATNARNIFDKMGSQETIKNFAKFGIDLPKEMDEARKKGEDVLETFTKLSNRAIKGDLTKLPLLFNDTQMKAGMQSMITSVDRYDHFLHSMDSGKVEGTVLKDVQRIVGDTTSSIQRLSSSWDNMVTRFGKTIAGPASSLMDTISDATDQQDAVKAALRKQGLEGIALDLAIPNVGTENYNHLARQGGYVPPDRDDLKRMQKEMPFAYETLGHYPQRPMSKSDFSENERLNAELGQDVDLATVRTHMARKKAALLKAHLPEIERYDAERERMQRRRDEEPVQPAEQPFSLRRALSMDTRKYVTPSRKEPEEVPFRSSFPAREEFPGRNERPMSDLKLGRDDGFADMARQMEAQFTDGGDKLRQGASEAGDKINEGAQRAADTLKQGAANSGQTLGSEAVNRLLAQANEIGAQIGQSVANAIKSQVGNLSLNVNANSSAAPQKVNADTGKTNGFVKNPTSVYHGPK